MPTKQALPGWGVNRVKVSRMASHETLCFGAEVTLDDKKVGTAFNDGHGGSTFVTLSEEFLRTGVVPDRVALVEHVDRLVEDHVALKDLQRTYKRWSKQLDVGRCFVLRKDELKAWESGDEHQESMIPPFRVYSSVDLARKHNAGLDAVVYTAESKGILWDAFSDGYRKWRVLEDARVEKMLADYEAELQARSKNHKEPPASPQMPDGY